MVVSISDDMRAAMSEGSYQSRHVLSVFYDGRPTLQGIPVSKSGNITGKASSRVQTSGRLFIESDAQILNGQGSSVSPREVTDALASYGQEAVVTREVYVGGSLVGAQSLGRFRITEVPTNQQTARRFGATRLITSSTVELVLKDMLEPIDAAQFEKLEAPRSSATVWSEIRRLSPIPVVQAVGNPSVAPTVIYDDNRLDTFAQLLLVAGAVPHVTRSGAFSARPADPKPSPSNFVVDLTGTIKDMGSGLSNDFYNIVIVTTTANGVEQIGARASIQSGPLRPDGPAGARVLRRSAGLATTPQAMQALADAVLSEQLRRRTRTVVVKCLPNVELELGDPVRASDPQTGTVEYGMASGIAWSMDPTDLMSVELETAALQ